MKLIWNIPLAFNVGFCIITEVRYCVNTCNNIGYLLTINIGKNTLNQATMGVCVWPSVILQIISVVHVLFLCLILILHTVHLPGHFIITIICN